MNKTPGRIIRFALVGLFFGTIVLGGVSFLIYFNKQEKAHQRSVRYASGLRRELDAAGLGRHEKIILDAFATPPDKCRRTLATYLESTFGPENMGYAVRSVADKHDASAPPAAIEIELTGSKRPQDVVLVLCGYLPDLSTIDQAQLSKPLAAMLGIAHSLTGRELNRSVRFVAVPDSGSLSAYYAEAVSNQDRITHLVLLGNLTKAGDAEVLSALHQEGRGAVLKRPEFAGDLVESASRLRDEVLNWADRL